MGTIAAQVRAIHRVESATKAFAQTRQDLIAATRGPAPAPAGTDVMLTTVLEDNDLLSLGGQWVYCPEAFWAPPAKKIDEVVVEEDEFGSVGHRIPAESDSWDEAWAERQAEIAAGEPEGHGPRGRSRGVTYGVQKRFSVKGMDVSAPRPVRRKPDNFRTRTGRPATNRQIKLLEQLIEKNISWASWAHGNLTIAEADERIKALLAAEDEPRSDDQPRKQFFHI